MVAKSNISGAKIPPGQLVNFIQKGIMYAELERSIAADGTDHPSTEPFSLLQSPAAEKRGGKGASGGASSSEPVAMDTDGGGGELTPEEQVTTLAGHDGEVFICAWSPTSLQLASGSGDSTARIWAVPSGACGKAQTKAMAAPSVLQHVGADKEKVKDVTTLDWSPDGASLATGAYDGQARIWSGAAGKLLRTLTKHKGPIFSIKWNRTGARRPHARRRTRRRPPTTRARARVSLPQASTCSRGRSTRRRLCGTPRRAPSSSSSPSTISLRSTFAARHSAGACRGATLLTRCPSLPQVDWRDETSFASCSTDKMVYVCKVGQDSYLKCFEGHQDEARAPRLPTRRRAGPSRAPRPHAGERDQVGPVRDAPRVVLGRLHREDMVARARGPRPRPPEAHEGGVHDQVGADGRGIGQPGVAAAAGVGLIRHDDPAVGPRVGALLPRARQAPRARLFGRLLRRRPPPRQRIARQLLAHMER